MTTSLYCPKCKARITGDTRICSACGQPQATSTNNFTHLRRMATASTSAKTTNTSPPPSRVFNQRYRLIKVVDQGEAGNVYLAVDTHHDDNLVALKEMNIDQVDPADVPGVIERFQRETHLLASLHHPFLPVIHEYFTEKNHWYLVMSFIEGQTLEASFDGSPGKKLPVNEVIRIGIELCEVLAYLHTHEPPIIFRDLTPLNIMLTPEGHICLINFGIARYFKQGQTNDTAHFSSPGYASPEYYSKAQASPRADIYSLGAIFHQMLSGQHPSQHPFQFPSLEELDPTIPVPLAQLILQMLKLNKLARPSHVLEVKRQLEQIREGEQGMPDMGEGTNQTQEQEQASVSSIDQPLTPTLASLNQLFQYVQTWLQKEPQFVLTWLEKRQEEEDEEDEEEHPTGLEFVLTWLERRLSRQPLTRRSVLIGLLGGGAVVGGGTLALRHALMNSASTKNHLITAQVSKKDPTTNSINWANPQQITTTSSQTSVALAGSSNGILGMIFAQKTRGNTLQYLSSKDNGATWSNPYAIAGQASKVAPSLGIAPDGTLCMAYVANSADSRLWYTSSKDNGITWSTTSLVSGQANRSAPALAIAPDGTLHIFYVADSADNRLWYTSSQNNGISWSAASLVPGPVSKTAPALTIGDDGTLHLAFVINNDEANLQYMFSQNNGTSWSSVYYPGPSSLLAPALAILNNTLYLAFVTNDGSNQIYVLSSKDGSQWSNEQEVGQSSLLAPALTIKEQTFYLAFVTDDGSNQLCVISSF